MTRTVKTPPGDLAPNGLTREMMEKVESGVLAKRVFWPATIIMVAFIGWVLAMPDTAQEIFSDLQSTVIGYFGWYYVALVAFFVVFALYVGFSRLGDVKIGSDDDEPDFSFLTWLSFLFAAGMGIGLVFYGASEPLMHYVSPRPGVGGNEAQVAQAAMSQSFLHWGLHPWAIYVIVGLALAYATHRQGLPLSIRYALKPIFGKRIEGGWGDVIDVIALVGTLFGVATSMGLGVMQIAAGLGYMNIDANTQLGYVAIIAVLTVVTLISVVTGLEKGMKILSNGNLILAAVVCIFVLLVGPTLFIFREFVAAIGAYLQNFISLTFNTLALYGDEGQQFQAAWTTFYWGWWISWSPFVGMFIARVSKGRTVREFVLGVLLAPSLISFFWFTVMGGSALYRQLFQGGGLLEEDGSAVAENILFRMLEGMPASSALIIGAVLLIIIFFVTSADSGALVLGMISTHGSPEPKTWIRVFWTMVAGLAAVGLLVAGGTDSLTTIQTVAILTALPFSAVILLMCASLAKTLRHEHNLIVRAQRRQTRREIERAISDRVADNIDEMVASEVKTSVSKVVDARVEAAVDAAVADAVADVDARLDKVVNQVDLHNVAIEQMTDTQAQRLLTADEIAADQAAKTQKDSKFRAPWKKN
ncbi:MULTISPECIES: BCCT family transporter [unclassified Rothia (in: high G+C Gram-positive bacteria)]|uniref:BCCT family transporter n=1 Tax=unclassified Rothia (in: high G+C Gram-positive bacteria) TaxID=2689056 RepID=UPI00195E555F|nr:MULTISPECIES: BCCT family transporter [unclassified Rothia (in: high G+C Gram-positive bacteria)]MBM7051116.1 BCCT family transporter [Rothia sp. ZJ1223]QRZ62184.1 BCCT family transporter [Rothia sp. ZJ932]